MHYTCMSTNLVEQETNSISKAVNEQFKDTISTWAKWLGLVLWLGSSHVTVLFFLSNGLLIYHYLGIFQYVIFI